MNKKLLDRVLEQIVKDVESGDLTAIAELIADIPDDKAIHFLPEEEHSDMNKSDTELHGLIDLVVDQIKQDLSKAITAKETEMDDTELHGGGFTWNYRIVNAKSENGGEDWYCLREVCYDMQGQQATVRRALAQKAWRPCAMCGT